jgi:hypothetical protein
MPNRVEIVQFGNVVLTIDIPENLPGTKQVDAATLSGQAIGSTTCPNCGATLLLDGETPIVGTCNCA